MFWTSNVNHPSLKKCTSLLRIRKLQGCLLSMKYLTMVSMLLLKVNIFLFHNLLEYSFYMNGLHDFVDLAAPNIQTLVHFLLLCNRNVELFVLFTRTYTAPLLFFLGHLNVCFDFRNHVSNLDWSSFLLLSNPITSRYRYVTTPVKKWIHHKNVDTFHLLI